MGRRWAGSLAGFGGEGPGSGVKGLGGEDENEDEEIKPNLVWFPGGGGFWRLMISFAFTALGKRPSNPSPNGSVGIGTHGRGNVKGLGLRFTIWRLWIGAPAAGRNTDRHG